MGEESMEKHLLITVGDDKSAMFGVQFVSHLFKNKDAIKLTLFYTAPRPPAVWADERKSDEWRQAEQKFKEYEAKGKKALAAAKDELAARGFVKEKIDTKLRFRELSKIMDIIDEGESGLYDAVVLGRRGISWFEETFDESVTKGLMEKRGRFPMWICRRPDLNRKDVLVCLDGSDSAYRVADHVGFVLAREEDQRIQLFVVKKKGKTTADSPQDILAKGRKNLTDHGIPDDRIHTKIEESDNVRKAILNESETGGFSAVAVGRTGSGQGFLKKLFMGSASGYLFKELESAALWICQ
jgi:nucleotide-binding universal stress UspA family protein